MIRLTNDKIDTEAVLAEVQDNSAGASVLFVGTTREFTDGRQTSSLEYECYPEMAEKKLGDLVEQAQGKWPIVRAAIVHRLGNLGLGEASIAVAISSAHRVDAFQAAQWIMDRLKEVVPIWKKENWSRRHQRLGPSRRRKAANIKRTGTSIKRTDK